MCFRFLFSLFCSLVLFWFWDRVSICSSVAWNSLPRPSWPQTHGGPPGSPLQMLRSQVYTSMPGLLLLRSQIYTGIYLYTWPAAAKIIGIYRYICLYAWPAAFWTASQVANILFQLEMSSLRLTEGWVFRGGGRSLKKPARVHRFHWTDTVWGESCTTVMGLLTKPSSGFVALHRRWPGVNSARGMTLSTHSEHSSHGCQGSPLSQGKLVWLSTGLVKSSWNLRILGKALENTTALVPNAKDKSIN